MPNKSNKVKFGLKNCHYAKATFDEDGNVTYAKPVRMPGAVSLSIDPSGENENFYADDIVYYVINNNSGYEGDLELALIPESFLKDILHEEEDANGVLAENADVEKHPDVVFGMMFNQRTNCVYRKMRELVQSGIYGGLRRTNWIITDWYRPQAYFDSGNWRATWSGEGGGVLLNQAPHNLDLWQWICGMPVKISAHMKFGKWHDIEVEDDVTAYCEYENGATGVFVTTTGDAKGTNRFEIQLDRAKIVADYSGLSVIEYDMTEQEFSATNKVPFGSIGSHKAEIELDGKNPQHDGVLRAWGGAILRGEPLVAHGSEGIYGLTISNAIHLSAWLGKEIDVRNLDENLFYSELQKRVATSRRKEHVVEQVADTSGTYAGAK